MKVRLFRLSRILLRRSANILEPLVTCRYRINWLNLICWAIGYAFCCLSMNKADDYEFVTLARILSPSSCLLALRAEVEQQIRQIKLL